MIEQKLFIHLLRKSDRYHVLATGKSQLAREMDLHENTIRRLFKKAVANGGFFENERWLMIISWELVKGNRGIKGRRIREE